MFYLAAAVSDFYIPASDMPEHKIQSSNGPLQVSKESHQIQRHMLFIRDPLLSQDSFLSCSCHVDQYEDGPQDVVAAGGLGSTGIWDFLQAGDGPVHPAGQSSAGTGQQAVVASVLDTRRGYVVYTQAKLVLTDEEASRDRGQYCQ